MLTLTVNYQKVLLPTELAEITLAQHLDFWEKYGRELQQKTKELQTRHKSQRVETDVSMEELAEFNEAIDLDNLIDEEALRWLCYWGNGDLESSKKAEGLQNYLLHFRIFKTALWMNETEALASFKNHFFIAGEEYSLQDFRVSGVPEQMTSKERIVGNYVMNVSGEIANGNWAVLSKLLVIYLRKNGEVFNHDFLLSAKRMELVNSLSMDHALAICYFLLKAINQLGLPDNEYLQPSV